MAKRETPTPTLAQTLDRARQLASRAYDWNLGIDGKIQMDDGEWVSTYDLMLEFEHAELALSALPDKGGPRG